MRPALLNPLFAPISSLKGVGPKIDKALQKLAGETVADLLFHLPGAVLTREPVRAIDAAMEGRLITLEALILGHQLALRSGQPSRVHAEDSAGRVFDLVFFHRFGNYLLKQLPQGEKLFVSGKLDFFQGKPQIAHPDYIARHPSEIPLFEPVYPLTAGIGNRALSGFIRQALDLLPGLPEWQDAAFMKQEGFPSFPEALRRVHFPASAEEAKPGGGPARTRLAYDELLANQLGLLLIRQDMKVQKGRPLKGTGEMRAKALAALPFELTGDQEKALAEIDADMASEDRMLRLLQGDVGSGKTIVAFLAALSAIEAGHQAALMAPTEILASQHFATVRPLAESIGLPVCLLTGSLKEKDKKAVKEDIAAGKYPLVIGTHALFQDDVSFPDLAFAVIDEQHRFGVHQRLRLSGKSERPCDLLVMSATPIPRTLALTLYGDMDVSVIMEKPKGRKPIRTTALPLSRLDEAMAGLARPIEQGQQVYWVCPLVEETEASDLTAAKERFDRLDALFPGQAVLLHGRMKPEEKERAMLQFSEGKARILVATTIVEVGMDVPEATVMVVEHAERFGLSQLHQLRGRVGRGETASVCLLLYAEPLAEVARARLAVMKRTENGFEIAEEDLKLRGGGDIIGTKQSGFQEFRIADLAVHQPLLQTARQEAKLVLQKDPKLASPRGEALRTLLYLFGLDHSVKTLHAG